MFSAGKCGLWMGVLLATGLLDGRARAADAVKTDPVSVIKVVDADDVARMKAILAVDKNAWDVRGDQSGETLLHHAKSAAMAKLLVEAGVDPKDVDDETGTTAIRWAAYHIRPEVVAYLRDKSPKPEDEFFLAAVGDVEGLKAMLSEKLGLLNEKVAKGDIFSEGASLLHVAAWCGQTKVCGLLLDKGMDVNVRGGWGNDNPIESAAYQGFAETVGLLLDRGADGDMRDSGQHHNALWWAAVTGRVETVKVMLKHAVKAEPELVKAVEDAKKKPYPGRELPGAEAYEEVGKLLEGAAATRP